MNPESVNMQPNAGNPNPESGVGLSGALSVNVLSISPAGGVVTVAVEYSTVAGWVLDESYTFTGPGIAAQAKMKIQQRYNDLAALLLANAALQGLVGPMVMGG